MSNNASTTIVCHTLGKISQCIYTVALAARIIGSPNSWNLKSLRVFILYIASSYTDRTCGWCASKHVASVSYIHSTAALNLWPTTSSCANYSSVGTITKHIWIWMAQWSHVCPCGCRKASAALLGNTLKITPLSDASVSLLKAPPSVKA
jgi:hypothetical protein